MAYIDLRKQGRGFGVGLDPILSQLKEGSFVQLGNLEGLEGFQNLFQMRGGQFVPVIGNAPVGADIYQTDITPREATMRGGVGSLSHAVRLDTGQSEAQRQAAYQQDLAGAGVPRSFAPAPGSGMTEQDVKNLVQTGQSGEAFQYNQNAPKVSAPRPDQPGYAQIPGGSVTSPLQSEIQSRTGQQALGNVGITAPLGSKEATAQLLAMGKKTLAGTPYENLSPQEAFKAAGITAPVGSEQATNQFLGGIGNRAPSGGGGFLGAQPSFGAGVVGGTQPSAGGVLDQYKQMLQEGGITGLDKQIGSFDEEIGKAKDLLSDLDARIRRGQTREAARLAPQEIITGRQAEIERDASLARGDLLSTIQSLQEIRSQMQEAARQGRQDVLTMLQLQEREQQNKLDEQYRQQQLQLQQQQFSKNQEQQQFENQLAQQKFEEDKRRFGLDYSLQQQKLTQSGVTAGGETGTAPTPQETYTKERVDRLTKQIDDVMPLITGGTTGLDGKLKSKIAGTKSYELQKAIDTIKANIGFNELQEMRNASKTGGALGQIAVQELDFLQSVLGSLDIGQSEETLKGNLRKVRESVQRWNDAQGQVNDPEGILDFMQQGRSSKAGNIPFA